MLVVDGVAANVTGGNGGNGGYGDYGAGNGGNGGNGVTGNITVNSGSATVTGGNGGSGGGGILKPGSAGSVGQAISGTITATTAEESDNNSTWKAITGTASTKRYVKAEGPTTPAHSHSFTYSASGATITANCASGCPDGYDTNGIVLTLSASNANYTSSAYTGASLSDTTAWTAAGLTVPTIEYVGRSDTTYEKSTTAPTNAGTYTASITVDTDKTATADFTISPVALTITGATATNRAYDKDNTAVTISAVAFKDSSDQVRSITLGESGDYTVTGAMSDANAGDNKEVAVTVTLKNDNYSLATNTTTTTVNISKADPLLTTLTGRERAIFYIGRVEKRLKN